MCGQRLHEVTKSVGMLDNVRKLLLEATSEREFKWPLDCDGIVISKPYPTFGEYIGAPKYGYDGHAGGLMKSPFALEVGQLPTRQCFAEVFDMLFENAMALTI